MSTHFKAYQGRDFLTAEFPKRDWLIEKLIREGDSVILVGNEKSGKSLFIFQAICSLTTCHPFIDIYTVPKPNRVVYVQLEGEISDSQDRMKRMVKSLDINPDLFTYFFYPPLELEQKQYAQSFAQEVIKQCNLSRKEGEPTVYPDILIIDPIYFAFRGSLSDDEVVREFIGNLRILKDTLKCAIILVHHTHKQKWSVKGEIINEGDEALFGSKFLKAWADHILMFLFDKAANKRSLHCNTQRSGDILKECNLHLVEPDPLYFREDKNEVNKDLFVLNFLQGPEFKEGLSAEEITNALGISRTHFYKSIKQPLAEGMILKLDGQRPIKYAYNWAKHRDKPTP